MIEQFFLSLIGISLTTSIVIIMLVLLSSRLNKHYKLKWKYWLWILLAIRLIIPFNPSINPKQLTFHVPNISINQLSKDAPTQDIELSLEFQPKAKQSEFTILHMIILIWFLGFIIFLMTHVIIYLNFKWKILRQGHPIKNELILNELSNISTKFSIHTKILPLTCSRIYSPMIIGFRHPILILPTDKYNIDELSFILKHELIHLKRHDNYYKLLLIISNSLHWFNPVIYLLVKEATNDLELSCDMEVIKDSSISQRKAYTEAIFSTIGKQNSSKIKLSTQFYGGTKIMKQRFAHILSKQPKKNGLLMILIVVLMTLLLGSLVACSTSNQSNSNSDASESVSNITVEPINKDIPDSESLIITPEPTDKDIPDNESINITPEPTIAENTTTENNSTTETLSEDAQEIKNIVEEFSAAYFKGDITTLKTFLTDSYEWVIDAYSETDESANITDTTLKGLSDIATKNIKDVCVVSLEFRPSVKDDAYKYLTIELIKESDGWKIYFYGIEG